MNKKLILTFLIFALVAPAGLSGDKEKKTVISPGKTRGNYHRLEDKLVYAGNNIVVTVKRLNPADERRFLKLKSGEAHNYLLNEEAKKKFQLYLLKFVNHSDKKLVFNPGFSSINTGNDRLSNKNYTDVYSFLKDKHSGVLKELKTEFNKYYYDVPRTIQPEESTVKMLAFEAFSENDIEDFKLELSWLYLGEKTFHLYFPFRVKYIEP